MIVGNEIIDEVLRPYLPSQRVLLGAEVEHGVARGQFKIGESGYYSGRLKHATDIEIQLCLNQLSYVFVAEAIRQKVIPEITDLDFNKFREESMLILESRKRFRRPIDVEKEINGEIKLEDWRNFGRLLVGRMNFDFEKRSCVGNLTLAISGGAQ